jgi:hypothetical protein
VNTQRWSKDRQVLHDHTLLHDHHIRTSGNGEQPAFTDEAGRSITTY